MTTASRQQPQTDELLSIEAVASRWGLSVETTWDRVREHNVSGVWVGKGKYDPSRAGPKTVRFRLADIQAWEASQVVALGYPRVADVPVDPLPMPTPEISMPATIPGWDGVDRLSRRRRR